jgi:hypothetical protein
MISAGYRNPLYDGTTAAINPALSNRLIDVDPRTGHRPLSRARHAAETMDR